MTNEKEVEDNFIDAIIDFAVDSNCYLAGCGDFTLGSNTSDVTDSELKVLLLDYLKKQDVIRIDKVIFETFDEEIEEFSVDEIVYL